MRCRPGIVSNTEPAKVPALQCTAARCTASGTRDIVLAAASPARALRTTTKRKQSKNKEGRRSAERRIVSPIAACAAARPHREARPPSGAPPRHSPPAITPMAQPQNRVSARRGGAVFCRHAAKLPCVKYAPYRPVLLPADRCPRAARERFARPRAGIRTRSAYKIASGMRPSVSEIRRIL
jgi:hypothetical protein